MSESRWGVGGVVFALVLVCGYAVVRHWPPVGSSAPRPAKASVISRVIRIGDSLPVTIDPREYRDYPLIIPARTCRFEGEVHGLAGGHRDFEGLLLSEAEYQRWLDGDFKAGRRSGKVTRWSPAAILQGPDTFHLLVNNGFSLFTTKEVRVAGRAVCPA